MLFNSLEFLIFFPVVVSIYFMIPHKYRWALLLIASYYFYMSWRPEYILLIIFSTLVDYYAGLKMSELAEKAKKKKYLIASLATNLGLLFVFKYFNFFSESTRTILQSFSLSFDAPVLKLLLPVGISFYTFQTLSYTIDVYLGKMKPEKHLGIFAVYVAFFPQLVAGPIERAKNLLPQFYEKHNFDYQKAVSGLRLMLWGFFLKVVIADRLAITVDSVYNNVTDHSAPALIIATYFFAFQIYCDFAGYSFIAIGAARVMGFRLMENFKRPYYSKSISEFWSRWHISLSTWFRDYLYIPLGGNRVKRRRWLLNIFIVFLVSGLWHGAGWTFVVWGALHGTFLIVSILTKDIRLRISKAFKLENFPKLMSAINMFATFHLVVFAWIFFRANTIADAFYILKVIFTKTWSNIQLLNFPISARSLFIIILLLMIMEVFNAIHETGKLKVLMHRNFLVQRWIIYVFLILVILLFGEFRNNQFIYFQF